MLAGACSAFPCTTALAHCWERNEGSTGSWYPQPAPSQASWAMRFNLLHGTNAAAAGGFQAGKRLAPSTNMHACYCFNFHILQLGRPNVIILPRQKSLSGSLLLEIMQKIGGMLTVLCRALLCPRDVCQQHACSQPCCFLPLFEKLN